MLINAGQRVSADVLNELIPLNNIKNGGQGYSNTTLTKDTDLWLDVVANTNYLFEAFLIYDGGLSGSSDIQVQWTVPSGATLRWTNIGTNASGGTTGSFCFVQSDIVTGQTSGIGQLRAMTITGSLAMGSSDGVLQLWAAKNSSSTNDTTIHMQSYVALQEVG
jgi:hypothetical protein